jgi:hypothetical protein
MTIWILALLLFALMILIGYTQGAIQSAFSLVGLITAVLLATKLGPFMMSPVKALLGAFGVKNPLIIGAVAPVVVFVIIIFLFKAGGFAVHRKVALYYKYKASELQAALWERMNARVGACLGTVSALIYLLLFAAAFYPLCYWTAQLSSSDNDPRTMRLVNRFGRDLAATSLSKVARTMDPLPESFYLASDIVGLVYHNPLSQGRLSRYPTLLGLGERAEFKELANDRDLSEMLQRQVTINELLKHPKIKAILDNPVMLEELWNLFLPDLQDLHDYMVSGESARYGGEKLYGRWTFSASASANALKQGRTNLRAVELRWLRHVMLSAYSQASFMATPDHQAYLKDVFWIKPSVKTIDTNKPPQSFTGQWKGGDGQYTLALQGINKEMSATIENGRLKMSGDWTPLIFNKEE